MIVKLKRLHEDAVIPFKTYDGDFCYDMVAVSEKEVAPNVWEYRLGWAMQLVRGDEPFEEWGGEAHKGLDLKRSPLKLSIDVRPRSSIWKTGMVLSNGIGTVDELYTGEVKAVFYHVFPNMPRYKVGDKVCQIKVGGTIPLRFVLVDELDNTERGDGGYGSTDKKKL